MDKLPPIEFAKEDFVGAVSGFKELAVCEIDKPIKRIELHNNFDDINLHFHWHKESGLLSVSTSKAVEL
jgi:hypothetical protein